jgi:hypothetical protein
MGAPAASQLRKVFSISVRVRLTAGPGWATAAQARAIRRGWPTATPWWWLRQVCRNSLRVQTTSAPGWVHTQTKGVIAIASLVVSRRSRLQAALSIAEQVGNPVTLADKIESLVCNRCIDGHCHGCPVQSLLMKLGRSD